MDAFPFDARDTVYAVAGAPDRRDHHIGNHRQPRLMIPLLGTALMADFAAQLCARKNSIAAWRSAF